MIQRNPSISISGQVGNAKMFITKKSEIIIIGI